MPFDPDKFLADTESAKEDSAEFDPDAFLAQTEPKGQPISKAESFGRGILQGGAREFADDNTAKAEQLIAALSSLTGIGPQDVAQKVLFTPEEKLAAEYRADYAEADKANPGTATLGRMIGGLPAAIASTMAGVGPVVGGMVEGAISGAGAGSEGNRLVPAIGGAVAGGVIGKGAEKVVQVGAGLTKKAVEALGGRLGFSTKIISEAGEEKADELIGALRKKGVGMRGMSPEILEADIERVGKQAGETLGRAYSKTPVALTTSQTFIRELQDEVLGELERAGRKGNAAKIAEVMDWMDDFAEKYPENVDLNPAMIWEQAKNLGQKVYKEGQKGLEPLWLAVKKKLQNGMKAAAPEVAEALRAADLEYQAYLKATEGLAAKAAARRGIAAKDSFSLPEAMHQRIARGVKEAYASGVNKGARVFEKLDTLMDERVLSKMPEGARRALKVAKEKGPQAFAAMWYTIANQFPALQKAINDIDPEEQAINESPRGY